MKGKLLAIAAAVAALIGCIYCRHAWIDTHPHYELIPRSFDSYSIDLPAQWPDPEREGNFVGVHNVPDSQEGSLDQFRWALSIFDEGTGIAPEEFANKKRAGNSKTPALKKMRLVNGIDAMTWTVWVPRGELNQEHRGYVFIAPNGHLYYAWQPLASDWRTRRRYDNLFRAALGSMKFK